MSDEDEDNTLPPSEETPSHSEPVIEGSSTASQFDELPPEEEEELFMKRNAAGLSSGPGKMIAFAVVMLVVVGYLTYTMFFASSKPAATPRAIPAMGGLGSVDAAPVAAAPAPAPAPALAQAAPEPVAPTPPPPPPAPPAPPAPPSPVKSDTSTPTAPPLTPAPPPPSLKAVTSIRSGADKNDQARIRSNMMVVNNGGSQPAPAANANNATKPEDALAKGDSNRTFANQAIAASATQKEGATQIKDLNLTIAQGKIVDAVMETAINTDLPGTLRAIVSRDVFAESGHDVLIPKGSRLIGTYNTGVARGQVRVMVIWTRLIRPDGIDIQIGSPGIDALGRAGVLGIADNKYSEIFSAAILTSVLDVGIAVGVDALSSTTSTTTTNSNGTTSVGSSAAPAAAATVGTLGSISKDVVNSMLDLRPTITVDQGTKINVFVNKDLFFPSPVYNPSASVE